MQRLAVLRDHDILDSIPEAAYDEIVSMAAAICEVPMAAISLVDEDRQWFKSEIGMGCKETGRESAFCAHALDKKEILLVPDATLDERFADNPLVTGAPGIRFYAGTPLITREGMTLGTLCVIDRVPRQLDARQTHALEVLGRSVVMQMEARRQIKIEKHRSILLQEAQLLARMGSWEMDYVTGRLLMSADACGFLGLSEEEFDQTLDTFMDCVFPEDRKLLERTDEAADLPMEVEYRVRRADGATRWLLQRGLLERDAAGTPLRRMGMIMDVTERKESEVSLRRRDEQSRAIVDTAHNAFVGINAQGVITEWNRQAETMFGWTRDEALGQSMAEMIIPPQYRAAHHQGLARFLASGVGPVLNKSIELSALRRNGSEFPVELRIAPIPSTEGLFFAAFIKDIESLKRNEQALLESQNRITKLNEELEGRVLERTAELAESEQRYRFLANSLPQIIWTSKPDGNLDYYNQRWFDYTGLTMEQTKDWGWEPVLHPDDVENCVQRWTHSFTTGEDYEVEYRFKRASDGVYRWHLGRAFPMRRNGEIILWVGTCTDIEDYKKFEADLQEAQLGLEKKVEARTAELATQAKELERSNLELEHFAYLASHDLQEPLRMVASFTQLLSEKYQGQLDAEAQEFIGFAVDGAKRMKQLIEGLLNYSRVGKKGTSHELVPCDVAVDGALANLQVVIGESKAIITRDALPTVHCDLPLLTQLFQNLIGNAIKFHSTEPPKIHISAEKDGNEWRISVADNGIGIHPRHTERIFVIFQRLHSTAAYPGTGIGLAICKKIVEHHGGTLKVKSQPGEGSCFQFTLPVKLASL